MTSKKNKKSGSSPVFLKSISKFIFVKEFNLNTVWWNLTLIFLFNYNQKAHCLTLKYLHKHWIDHVMFFYKRKNPWEPM